MTDLHILFAKLARSSFRRRLRLGQTETEYLNSRGMELVLQHASDFVAKRLAPEAPANDGKQTPWRGHPVFIAQHATGTCCRSCLAKWHQIPAGRALTGEEQSHILAAIERWLLNQLECGGSS